MSKVRNISPSCIRTDSYRHIEERSITPWPLLETAPSTLQPSLFAILEKASSKSQCHDVQGCFRCRTTGPTHPRHHCSLQKRIEFTLYRAVGTWPLYLATTACLMYVIETGRKVTESAIRVIALCVVPVLSFVA